MRGRRTTAGGYVIAGRTHRLVPYLPANRMLVAPLTLVTHGSDYTITDADAARLPGYIDRWYSVNCGTAGGRVTALPLGFRDSAECRSALREVAAMEIARKKDVYLCVSIDRKCKVDRGRLYQLFADNPRVTKKGGGPERAVSFREYCEDIAAHKYVLSPPGAGPDCHRHWEALALGAIPVVQSSVAMSHFQDLPILFIDRWEDATPENLDAIATERGLWQRFGGRLRDVMRFAYWERTILGGDE